jgi:hypothetical protein
LRNVYLNLSVSNWVQSASHYPSINVEGRGLSAQANITKNDLVLSDGTPATTLSVQLSILETSRMQEELSKLPDNVIGRLNYSPYQPARADIPSIEAFVHGWVCLNAHLHNDVWHQVLTGGYRECAIRLNVGPIEFISPDGWRWDVENNQYLLIDTVSVDFTRRASLPKMPAGPPPKRSFWR